MVYLIYVRRHHVSANAMPPAHRAGCVFLALDMAARHACIVAVAGGVSECPGFSAKIPVRIVYTPGDGSAIGDRLKKFDDLFDGYCQD